MVQQDNLSYANVLDRVSTGLPPASKLVGDQCGPVLFSASFSFFLSPTMNEGDLHARSRFIRHPGLILNPDVLCCAALCCSSCVALRCLRCVVCAACAAVYVNGGAGAVMVCQFCSYGIRRERGLLPGHSDQSKSRARKPRCRCRRQQGQTRRWRSGAVWLWRGCLGCRKS